MKKKIVSALAFAIGLVVTVFCVHQKAALQSAIWGCSTGVWLMNLIEAFHD